MSVITSQDFTAHSTGRRFGDVLSDPRVNFQDVLDFFNDPAIRQRMKNSELHHDRPAFAGVVKSLEQVPSVDQFLSGHDAHTTQRFRQAVGVVILMAMTDESWKKTGKKGSLGRRAKVIPGTTTPGAYINASGLSRWFTQTERYAP